MDNNLSRQFESNQDEEKREDSALLKYTGIFSIFLTIGLIQGYGKSVILIIQSQGATLNDQAMLTLIYYPYLFKLIFAPIVDGFYTTRYGLGRSKTYILSSGILMFLTLILSGHLTEILLSSKSYKWITGQLFFLNLLNCFFQLAGEAWCVSLFAGNNRKTGSIILGVAQGLGYAFTYNIFIPLNSSEWCSKNIFNGTPTKTPVMSHSLLLRIVAFFLICTLIITFYIKEDNPNLKKMTAERSTPCDIIRLFPKIFENKYFKDLLFLVFVTKCWTSFFGEAISLRMVSLGFPKTSFANIETLLLPFKIMVSFLAVRVIIKGKMIRRFCLIRLVMVLLCIADFFNYKFYQRTKDENVTTVFLVFTGFFKLIRRLEYLCLFGFMTSIVDNRIGTTSLTLFSVVWNSASDIPNTIGLKLGSMMDLDLIVIVCISINLIVIMWGHPLAISIDDLSKKEFQEFEQDDTKSGIESEQGEVSCTSSYVADLSFISDQHHQFV